MYPISFRILKINLLNVEYNDYEYWNDFGYWFCVPDIISGTRDQFIRSTRNDIGYSELRREITIISGVMIVSLSLSHKWIYLSFSPSNEFLSLIIEYPIRDILDFSMQSGFQAHTFVEVILNLYFY